MAEDLGLDQQLKAFLVKTGLILNLGDDSGIPIEQLRAGYAAPFTQNTPQIPVKEVIDKNISGLDGNEIPIRIYHPANAVHQKCGLPILIFCHGGGCFAGSLDTHDDLCRNLGCMSGYIVVSVDYRLAPEHKFPAGHRDGYAATQWAHDNATEFGGNASLVAVAGDSAGGNIAAAICHMARDMGGLKIALQVLMYPMMQPTALYTTSSMEELAVIAPVLSKKMLEVAYDRLVENFEDQKSSLLDLNHAPSMLNLPPAYIVVAEFDPLRDEGAYYASRLSDNAVPTTLKCCGGTCHGFIHFNTLTELQCAVSALEEIAQAMRQAAKATGVAASIG